MKNSRDVWWMGVAMALLLPMALPAQNEVEQARKRFDDACQARVETPFSEGISKLREKYLVAVDRELQTASKAGDLDAAAALKREKESFSLEGNELPDPNVTNAVLVRLREAYREESKKLDAQRQAATAAVSLEIAATIKAREVELTKEQKIDEALALRAFRTELETKAAAGSAPKPKPAETVSEPGWQPLFNGRDLTGWRILDNGSGFTIVDGALKATRGPKRASYLYFTGLPGIPETLRNFELRATVKGERGANSGIYFHTNGRVDGRSGHPNTGLEVSLSNMENPGQYPTGAIYGVTAVAPPQVNESEWFDIRIRVHGARTTVWINERLFLDHATPYVSGNVKGLVPSGGKLALQGNSADAAFYFKRVEIRQLDR